MALVAGPADSKDFQPVMCGETFVTLPEGQSVGQA